VRRGGEGLGVPGQGEEIMQEPVPDSPGLSGTGSCLIAPPCPGTPRPLGLGI